MTNTSEHDKNRNFIRLGDDSLLHDQWLVSHGPLQDPNTGQGWVHVESSTSDNTVTIDDKKLTIEEARNLARALTEAADHAQTRPGTYRKTSNATTSIRHSTTAHGTNVTVRHHSTNGSSDVVVTQNGRVSVVQSGNVITGGSLIGYSPE